MFRHWSLLVLSFFLVSELNAQVATTVSGRVTDSTGAVISGADVNLRLSGSDTQLYAATTTSSGAYTLVRVNPGSYELAISAPGFQTVVVKDILVPPGQATEVAETQLELAGVEETVFVTAAESAGATTGEVASSLVGMQIRDMPVRDRNPLMPALTVAGVNVNQGAMMIVNGNRPAVPNITLDGISVKDNFVRSTAIDPLLLDQVAALTVASSTQNPAAYGGAGQISLVTPSGTNDYHGETYFWNRNSALASGAWFDNQARAPKPFLNQNQMGGWAGGRILPNRLFFYAAYEGYRQRQQISQNATVLTADARNGLFTYRDTGGTIRKVDLLQTAGLSQDSFMQALLAQVPNASQINNFNVGDSTAALLRNTAGLAFLKRNNRNRDYVTGKLDYTLSTRHSFTLTGLWNHDIQDLPAQDTTFSPSTAVGTDTTAGLLSSAWRWSPRANITNEARFGFYLAPRVTRADQNIPNFFVTGTAYTNPVLTTRTNGRNTNTYSFSDNASYLRAAHSIQFGFQSQQFRVELFSDAGITPSYVIGIGTGNPGLTTAQLPGAGANDITAANSLLATLAGYYTSYSQTFNVTSRSSGYVGGASSVRHYSVGDYALYIHDTWKALRRLTLNGGVRWDYLGVVDERDSLALYPVLQNNDPIQTLFGNATLGFSGDSAGRPWYHPDRNNFGPSTGLAWDILGTGKTLLRVGYSISFINDNLMGAASGFNLGANAGLSSTASASGLTGRVGAGVAAVPTPAYKVPRTFSDNFALSTASIGALIDPNLVTPYVQEWNFGLQQTIKNVVVEVRYVGNHGTKLIRGIDLNQVLIDDLLPDFKNARNNGFLSQQATGVFDPRFNASIAGSQPLPFFAQLPGGGNLTNATNTGLIMRGEIGELASSYQAGRTNGSVNFYPNPLAQALALTTNLSSTAYNALQAEATYRFARGIQIHANYTYSKVLTDSVGNIGTDFDPFLNIHNTAIERSRGVFLDLTHVFKAIGSYDLPLNRLAGTHTRARRVAFDGWNVAGIFNAQSGQPFSITAGGRGTLNRAGGNRSQYNTANTTLNKSQLNDLIRFRMTSAGPYFIAPSAIGPDGRGAAADGAAPFAGQVFFNPAPGSVGTLQRDWFSGPSISTLDLKISKTTRISERQSLELRLTGSNIFNHPNFFIFDQDINSTTFGKITQTGGRLSSDNRQLQLSLSYHF